MIRYELCLQTFERFAQEMAGGCRYMIHSEFTRHIGAIVYNRSHVLFLHF